MPTAASGRFLIVTWEGGGNVPPALALGQWLARAGHQACIAGPASLQARAKGAGLEFRPFTSVAPWPDGVGFEDDLATFDAIRNGPALATDVLALTRAEAPDVIVVDCMMGAAFAAAERAGVPTAALVHVLYPPFVHGWGQMVMDATAARAALELAPLDAAAPLEMLERTELVLVAVPAEFDFPDPGLASVVHYTGPVFNPEPIPAIWDSPWSGDDPRPLVLVSFGTTVQGQDKALPPVLDALADLPLRGLVTLGGVGLNQELVTPPNVAVRNYLPHHAVLDEVAVVVCHGGLSTIMASLAHGVPLVCVPQGREQGLNTQRVEECGAGICLPPDAAPAVIAKAVNDILGNAPYRDAAQSLRQVIGRKHGGQAAVEQLERLYRQMP